MSRLPSDDSRKRDSNAARNIARRERVGLANGFRGTAANQVADPRQSDQRRYIGHEPESNRFVWALASLDPIRISWLSSW